MASSLSMVFDLLAVDRASEVFKRVGDSAGEAGAKVEASTTNVSNAGSKIAAGLGVAAAAAAAYSVKLAADFQTNVTKLATTAGEAQSNLQKVSDGMLSMAGQVGIGATELAKGMYTIESSGIHGADALTTLKAAAQGARQEGADLTHVADALSTVLHDYNLPASAAADTTSKLVEAVAHGKTTFDELTASLHSVTPLAAALHVPLQDILGSLSAMTASGESADQATQNMADALRHLQSPTQTMTAELGQLGINSADLAGQLGTKGLAGVMQEISDAIVSHLDPATQKVLLPALNQSKSAAQDLQVMLGQMSGPLKSLSEGLLTGSTSISAYQKAVKGLGGEAGAQGLQFLSLYKSADGFNQLLKSGSPAAQEYSAALQKAVGDSAGLTVALQLTGEHAAATNQAIKDIAKASGDASGNIKGWAEVQSNFNQQAAEAGAKLQAMAIEAGQHLLPVLTDFFHFVNGSVLPAVETMGSGIGTAVHWFSELPGPIQAVALALVALRLADMVGLFDKLGSAVGGVKSAFQGFREEMALQQALQQMEVQSGNTEAAFGRLGSAGSVAMGKLKAGGSAVLDMFGGPWGAGIAGAVGVVALFEHGIQQATDTENKWVDALKQGGAAMQQAQSDMARTAAQEKSLNDGFAGFAATVGGVSTNIKQMTPDVDKATKSYQDWYKGLGLVDQKSQDLQSATASLNEVLKTHSADSLAAREAEDKVRQAQDDLKVATDELNQSTKTAAQLSQEQASALLALTGSSVAVKQSYDEFQSSYQQLLSDQAKGQLSTQQLTVEQDALQQSALNVAQAAGVAGQKWAESNHVTDTATASQYAQLLALQKVADQMGVNTPQSITTLIQSLQASVSQGHLTEQQMNGITAAVDGIPNQKNVNVTADTSAAQNSINALLGMYQHVQYTGSAIVVNGRVVANADGNLLEAYASGGMHPMSSSVAQVVKPGTLRVIGDNPVADEAFIPLNSSKRSQQILSEAAGRMGFGLMAMADGGIADQFGVQPSQAMLASAKAMVAAAFTGGGGGAGSPAIRALGQSIASAMGFGGQFSAIDYIFSHESGWNPNAQNPTSTAYGIPQFLNSTWAQYGGKTSDPGAQIRDGIQYMVNRYGSPNGAAAFWQAHHWYKNGTNYVPSDQLAVLHKGEAVVPADKNQGAPFVGGGPVEITGTLQIDGDGLAHIVNGQIVSFASAVRSRIGS